MEKNFHIITDSIADLPPTWLHEHEEIITVIPTPVIAKDKVYSNLSTKELAELITKGREEGFRVTTSSPALGDIIDAISMALAADKDVLYVAMSSDLSSTYQHVQNYVSDELINDPDLRKLRHGHKVVCIDSQCMTAGLGFLIRGAVAYSKNIDQAIDYIECTCQRIAHLFTVSDFNQLKESGRISSTQFILANFLKLRPLMAFQYVNANHRAGLRTGIARSTTKMITAMAQEVANTIDIHNPKIVIAKGYNPNNPTECDDLSTRLQNAILKVYPKAQIQIWDLGPAVACHVGPGSVGVFYERSTLDLSQKYLTDLHNRE